MLSKIRLSDMKIKLLDTVAVVTCQAEVEGTSDGASMRGIYRYTRVYQHLPSGEWKITSFEATRIRPMKSTRDKSGDASVPVSLGVVREPRFG
jgi:ketosteroid isomerase-like protein